MGELRHAMAMMQKLPTCIQQCKVKGAEWYGRYTLVGSVPARLSRQSWATEQEVIEALLAEGVSRFQKADCTWYEHPFTL